MQMPYQVQILPNTATTSSHATTVILMWQIDHRPQLQAQNSKKLQQRHGKIPSRSNSKTNQTFTSKDEQIEQLKSKIQQLKQSKENTIPSNIENTETTHKPKTYIRPPNQAVKQKSTQR